MSSFLCFICHNTVNSDTYEETREKYRDVVGINLCADSHLCYICCHMVHKLWLFKSVCLKRSLEYPDLFIEKGTLNLQIIEPENIILCSEGTCLQTNNSHICLQDSNHQNNNSDDYFKLETEIDIEENSPKNFITDNLKDFEGNAKFIDENDQIINQDDEHDWKINSGDETVENDEHYDHNTNEGNNFPNSNEGNEFDLESNKDCDDLDSKVYEEERDVCLNEIRNEEVEEGTASTSKSAPTKNKKSKKNTKNKKPGFEKIVLSVEVQKLELEAQRKSKKYLESEFKCYNCALGFLFKDTYQAHMMRHEESNGEYRCVLCSLRFASASVLRSHTSLHSVRYQCTRCHEYIRARQTKRHAKSCHDKTSEATCHLCGRVFQDGSGLQQHLKRFHNTKTSNRTYSCSVCGKSYRNQAAVRTHMIKHIHRKFPCDECSSVFSSPYSLTQHKKKHVQTDDVTLYNCATCDVTYTSRKSLLAHQRQSANHQQRTYECSICNRSCPNEKALSSHMMTVHSTCKQNRCETCNAAYTSRKSLLRHIRDSHTTPPRTKLAVCHICGNGFKGKNKLNRHLKEVCEKDKLEEELSCYYEIQQVI